MRQIHSYSLTTDKGWTNENNYFIDKPCEKMSSYCDNINLYYEYCKGMVLLLIRKIFRSYLRANTV